MRMPGGGLLAAAVPDGTVASGSPPGATRSSATSSASGCSAFLGEVRVDKNVPFRDSFAETDQGSGGGSVEFNLADLYECVAARIPEREVVVWRDTRLTHRQLDERANRLAHGLEG